MSAPDRSKRFDLSQDGQTGPQPKIWVEGRQRPRFDMAGFVATSIGMAKRDLAPVMADAEVRLLGFGQRVARGELRVGVAWAGRMGRLVPSHQAAGRWIGQLSALLRDTRAVLVPQDEKDDPLAYPNLVRGTPQAVTTDPDRPPTEPTLHAIRSAISDAPHDFGHETQRPQTPDRSDTPLAAGPGGVWRLVCWTTLGLLLMFAIPAGAVRALLFHLDGGDLRDWS